MVSVFRSARRAAGVLAMVVAAWAAYQWADLHRPHRVTGTSSTLVVEGRYYYVTLHGAETAKLPSDGQVPDRADPTAVPAHRWLLESDATIDNGHLFRFVDDRSLATFAMTLPASDTELRFRTVAMKGGGELLLVANGEGTAGSRGYYGYVTIEPRR